jgi:hypothetical protein
MVRSFGYFGGTRFPPYEPPAKDPEKERKDTLKTYFEQLPLNSKVQRYLHKHSKKRIIFQESEDYNISALGSHATRLALSLDGLEMKLVNSAPRVYSSATPKQCAEYVIEKGKLEGKDITLKEIQNEIVHFIKKKER